MKRSHSNQWLKPAVLIGLMMMAFFVFGIPSTSAEKNPNAFKAVNGVAAAQFKVPPGMEKVSEQDIASQRVQGGIHADRYQQKFGNAAVLGGQLTVYSDSEGNQLAVIGANYDDLQPANVVALNELQAVKVAQQMVGRGGTWTSTLMLNPVTNRYFYAIDNQREDARWLTWVDAESSMVVNHYDGLAHGSGTGVQGDTKDLTGLTTFSGGTYRMISADGRITTNDAGNRSRLPGNLATDSDDSWNTAGRTSPGQPALVDAHFFASITDQYYQTTHGFDWLDYYPQGMVSSAHVQRNYNNAYWNGSQMAYGDGDGSSFVELSGDLDVVGHELSHGVTEATSGLIYQNESGALNEAFSDIMGSSIEFYYGTGNWTVGEDITPNDNGIRNMANPNEDGDPSHYGERYTGTGDNGGVHINSGIANHWYYLLVEGGQNANGSYASGTNVSGIGMASAEEIAFLGFTALPASATFCDARSSTIAVAGNDSGNVADAWDEVGVNDALCGGGGGGGGGTGALNVTATTDKSSYSFGQMITMTAHVEDDSGAPVSGASVTATVRTGGGSTLTGSTTTNAAGDAVFTYTPRRKDGSGSWSFTGAASKTGYSSGSDMTTFTVN